MLVSGRGNARVGRDLLIVVRGLGCLRRALPNSAFSALDSFSSSAPEFGDLMPDCTSHSISCMFIIL